MAFPGPDAATAMNAHGAVPLVSSGASYEEVQREFTIDCLVEVWQLQNDMLGLPQSDPDQLRLMMGALADGIDEDVAMALLPEDAT